VKHNSIIRMTAAAALAVALATALFPHLRNHDIPEPPAIPADIAGTSVIEPRQPPQPTVPQPPRKPAAARPQTAVAPPAVPLPESVDAIPGEYSLTFLNARDREAFEALAARHGVRILDRMAAINALRIAAPDAAALRALLAAAPRPRTFAPNTLVRIPPLAEGPAAKAPATPYTGFGTGALNWLGVPEPDPAWGRGVRVAVLDTGINSTFSGNIAGRLDLTGEGIGSATHGGAVASLISGLQGMAPGAALLDLKVLGNDGKGDSFTLAKGILEAVAQGAQIINICAGTRGDSPALAAAVAYALSQNVLIIASVGNDGLPGVSYPAGYDGVIAVGGVDADGRHLHFSNTGAAVDISAPGIGIAVPGTGVGQTLDFSGTSAATPFVTAAAALLRAESPQLTTGEITALLKLYSNDAGAPGPDESIGAGILDAGRLMKRDDPGIVDIAIISPYLQRNEKRRIVVADLLAQNRGTVALPLVEMKAVINGAAQTLRFVNVGVGSTVAHTIEWSAAAVDADGLDIAVEIWPVGLTDNLPNNNAGRTVILPSAR